MAAIRSKSVFKAFLILEEISLKKLHESTRRGGGSIRSLSSATFNIIHEHPIKLIFGIYNELSLYFTLIEITDLTFYRFSRQPQQHKWRHKRPPSCFFKFSDFFHILFEQWKWWKQHLAIGIYEIVRSIVELSDFSHFLSEKLNLRTQHIGCVSCYCDVINRRVT